MPVNCPICEKPVKPEEINSHIDSNCEAFLYDPAKDKTPPQSQSLSQSQNQSQSHGQGQGDSQSHNQTHNGSGSAPKRTPSSFFSTPAPKRHQNATLNSNGTSAASPAPNTTATVTVGVKRTFADGPGATSSPVREREARHDDGVNGARQPANGAAHQDPPAVVEDSEGRITKKRQLQKPTAPLAERMRPHSFDQVFGQDLVGPNGVLRSLIESDRLPSMILWGASGTGKTTIARCIAHMTGARFVEMNATSTGTAEVKKLFGEAVNEQALTGRRTIIFCDEIHRFNKGQQDVFLKPVEAGTVILIGATTENPSFKVTSALLSRCRTFTLASLTTQDVESILKRALQAEIEEKSTTNTPYPPSTQELIDAEMITYLARFSDGDARTALNLLDLALSLALQPSPTTSSSDPANTTSSGGITKEDLKASLTKTLVYDRAGDQHYDTISAFHKSVRGNDPDAALYYLARMLQSGEDPLFIARRMVVIASEDVGLADNTLLPLATATYTATQQIGLPEARIPLAHCAIALCLAKKSTRAYRGLNNAFAALREPGVAALPVPLHLRNAPTRLMKEMGFGAEYKYPPNYRDGIVSQTYLPEGMIGRRFLEDRDLGTEVDPEAVKKEEE